MTGEHLTYRVVGSYSNYDESAEWTVCWAATREDAERVLALVEFERLEFGKWANAYVKKYQLENTWRERTYEFIQADIIAWCSERVERQPDLAAWSSTSYDIEVMSDDPYSRRHGALAGT